MIISSSDTICYPVNPKNKNLKPIFQKPTVQIKRELKIKVAIENYQ